jgi:hypothetical protein
MKSIRFSYLLLLVCAPLAIAPIVKGTTYNTPGIDGTIEVSPGDWDEDEVVTDDLADDSRYGEADIGDLYMTWDTANLYLGVATSLPPGTLGNGYVIFIDKDAHEASVTGATDFTGADFYPRHITFTEMGADIVVGGWNFETQFDVRDCVDPASTEPITGAVSGYNAGDLTFEVAIPWSGIYGGGSTVPVGAAMKIVTVSIGGDGSGAYDAAPNSGYDSDSDGIPDESDPDTAWDAYTDLDVFKEVVIDSDMDGIPDDGRSIDIEPTTFGEIKATFE